MRISALVRVATALGCGLAALVLLAPTPAAAPTAWPGWVTDAPPDLALVNAATLAAWLCLGWLGLCTLAVALGTVPGLCGHIATRWVTVLAPAGLRRSLEAALGITLATAPVVGFAPGALTTAWADARPPAPTWTTPSLDRPARPPASHPKPQPATSAYIVRRGDCLWSIAAAHLSHNASTREVAAAWPQWYADNKTIIGPDPDLIQPGQRLRAPGTTFGATR